jgi:RimJ/RimL family protein N-acetyltransferase
VTVLAGERCTLRGLLPSDAPTLQRHADDTAVWRNLFDGFPHPYTMADAQAWCGGGWRDAGDVFGIVVDGGVIGCVGATPVTAPGRSCNAEVGWWIGQTNWGRGIAADALAVFTAWIWPQRPQLTRLFATIFLRNPASMRVADKAGYQREGLLPRSIVKAGEVIDSVLYASYRPQKSAP